MSRAKAAAIKADTTRRPFFLHVGIGLGVREPGRDEIDAARSGWRARGRGVGLASHLRAERDGAMCVSAPEWDPIAKGEQCTEIEHKFALMQESRSAPIGTLPLLAFSMLHQSARSDSVGGPIPALKHRLTFELAMIRLTKPGFAEM